MRLFFALWPDAESAATLAAVARGCTALLGGKPTRAAAIHMTLVFLGEQPAARLPDIVTAARSLHTMPFDLMLDRLGLWRRNRLLWAGCQWTPAALRALAEALRAALRRGEIAFDDTHRFVPHVTLVRRLAGQCAPPAASARLPLYWPCPRFVLAESRLSTSGAEYRIVETFPA